MAVLSPVHGEQEMAGQGVFPEMAENLALETVQPTAREGAAG